MRALLPTIAALLCSACASAPRPAPAEPGTVFACGGGRLAEPVIQEFVVAAGLERAKLVVVPTASQRAEDPDGWANDIRRWQLLGIGEVSVLHTRDRARAAEPEFLAPLREATAVWFGGGSQDRIAAAYLDTPFEAEVQAVLARGGVVGGTSAGAAIMSRVMIAGGNPEPQIARGFDLVPGAIVDQHFRARDREARLRRAVQLNPDRIGVGIDEGTALVLTGTRARVIGAGGVTLIDRGGERFVPEGGVLDFEQGVGGVSVRVVAPQ